MGRVLYRWVSPQHWEGNVPFSRPQGAAFSLQGKSMSFFDSATKTPLDVLEVRAANYNRTASKRQTNAKSAVDLVGENWGVVQLDESALLELGFQVGQSSNSGHVDVFGTSEFIESMQLDLAETCIVFAKEDLLNSP